jgi:hypothetical protein
MALSPRGSAVAAGLVLLIILGCGLSVGGSPDPGPTVSHPSFVANAPADADGVFRQEGKVELHAGEERDVYYVYYPVPYVSPPHLELTETGLITGRCEIVAQQPTHFRARNTSASNQTAQWKARGVKGKVVQTVMPAPPAPGPSTLPPPAPPPEPVPADGPAVPAEPPGKAR